MIVGIPKETFPGERRVAQAPSVVSSLTRLGLQVVMERGAGDAAGFPDQEYVEKGVELVDRAAVFDRSAIVCCVRTYGANVQAGEDDLARYRRDQIVIGLAEPLTEREPIERLAATGARVFALELIPRITRAQSMDVLSSQATVAGYKAVVLAMSTLPKMFPMMMTAAGTVAPARVFVIGAGVAGLRAVAAARRAGAVVQAFDVRPEVREQVESLGAKFVQIEVGDAAGEGGYAREQTAEERQRQQDLMAETIADSDVVVTTAAVPGKKAPVLIPADVARRMHPGSVIVDMAAERGGNCELTRPDETVVEGGVTILGPTNLAASVPTHASQMFAKNAANLVALMVKDDAVVLDRSDEVITGTLLAEGGEIVHPLARKVFDLPPMVAAGGGADGSDA